MNEEIAYRDRSLSICLAKAAAIGILAVEEVYHPKTHARVVDPNSVAYRTALAYGAGGLSPWHEPARSFLDERGIEIVVLPEPGPSYRAIAFRGRETILERVLTPVEIHAPYAS